jgi:membrane associated rhomboid family serine protease
MIPTGGPFSNFARNLSQLASSPMTWLWVLSILGIEALVMTVGGPDRQPAWTWYEWLGLSREGILSGKFWQLLSYGLLHGNWLHTGANALFLLVVGSRIEHMAGAATMAKATVFGVLGGAVGHLLLAPGGGDAPLLVGMSGGCMGLLLVMTTLSPQSRMMPLPVSGRSLGLGVLVAELILALADPALRVPGLVNLGNWLVSHGLGHWFQMGHACHFGGGVAGWLFGRWLLRPRINLERLRRDRERRETRGPAQIE